MLRTPSLLGLASLCVVLLSLLELLDIEARRQQGFAASNQSVVNCARYLPTVAVVILGFIWRSLVSDLKLMMPWSSMTKKPAPASHSLLANYSMSMELISIWTSARRKHWPVCFGLLGALITGILVSFTNALTYVNISAVVSTDNVAFRQTSSFNFADKISVFQRVTGYFLESHWKPALCSLD